MPPTVKVPCLLHFLVSHLTHENPAGGSGERASCEELGFRPAEPVVDLALAERHACLQEPTVEGLDVAECRDGHERVPSVGPHLVLHVPPPVSRIGAGEGVAEPIVRGEPAEELGDPDLGPEAPADLRGIVEHRPGRHASHELEHVPEPLADALGGLSPEHLREPDAGVGEGDGQVLSPRDDAPHPEVRLAEVDLAFAGKPAELQIALRVATAALLGHLLAPLLHIALHGGIGASVAVLLPQPVIHLRGGVVLLAPAAHVAIEPGVYLPGIGREQLALGRPLLRHLRRQVLHPQILPDGRLRYPGLPRDRGDALASPVPSSYTLNLVHADHSFLSSSYDAVCRRATYGGRISGGGRHAHAHFRIFIVPKAETFRAQIPNLEAIKNMRQSCRLTSRVRSIQPLYEPGLDAPLGRGMGGSGEKPSALRYLHTVFLSCPVTLAISETSCLSDHSLHISSTCDMSGAILSMSFRCKSLGTLVMETTTSWPTGMSHLRESGE